MKALVTGATGFIGANLVRELLAQGHRVRALVRPNGNRKAVDGLDIELVTGDLSDADLLRRALDGCDALFHVAAAYAFWTPRPEQVYQTNVTGTENVLRAAMAVGTPKVVYTSTEGTVGMSANGLGGEDRPMALDDLHGAYKRSKLLAEQAALGCYREGLPLVIVNPTMPVGPYDVKPTPTGQTVVDFLNHRMPAYVNTGMNVVDVQDVARGHILAYEKGKCGERYLLGNRNLTYQQILESLAGVTGMKAPRLRMPLWCALGAACADELVRGRVFGKTPRIPIAVRAAGKRRFHDCSKAVRDLGLPQSPIEDALARAVAWFRQNGYVNA
jgi:dihydroflavonol-4-reductase